MSLFYMVFSSSLEKSLMLSLSNPCILLSQIPKGNLGVYSQFKP